MKKKLITVLNAVAAIVLLFLFFSQIGLESLTSQATQINLFWLAPAIACYLAMNFTSALRLKKILNLPLSATRVFFIHMQALLLSDFTPGRSGYAYLVYSLRNLQKTTINARVLGIVLASDFLIRALLVIASIALFAKGFLAAGVFLTVFSTIALLLFWKRVTLVEKILTLVPLAGKRLSEAYNEVFVHHVRTSVMLYSLYVSAVGAVLRGAAWWFVLYAIGFNASFSAFIVLCALLTSISFIPLSIAGLGVQEATGAFLFSSLLGIPATAAALLMILIRVVEVGSDLLGLKEFARAAKFKQPA